MSYKGVVKGNTVELEEWVRLPEGATVEVVPLEGAEAPAWSSCSKGSPQSILAALDIPPHCTDEDVDALMQAIEEGKLAVCFETMFDRKVKIK